jgi:hypothetical protein
MISRAFVVTGLVVVVAPCIAAAQSVASNDAWGRFKVATWSTSQSLGNVAPAVVEALQARFPDDRRLADRGQPFQATDIVTGEPTRRLVLAGRSDADAFVVYEQGGRGHHLVFVMFDTRGQVPRPVLRASGTAGTHDDAKGWQLNLTELKNALERGVMAWGDPDAPQH